MGRLHYGIASDAIVVPDRMLAHLRTVATTKLRRSESFTVSFRHAEGAGRSTLWFHPAIPLRFEFDSADSDSLDRDYLETLARAAAGQGGMLLDLSDVEEARNGVSAVQGQPIRLEPAA